MRCSNARLIAAAPNLLAALQYIAGHAQMATTLANDVGRTTALDNISDAARAAIAQATEEQTR